MSGRHHYLHEYYPVCREEIVYVPQKVAEYMPAPRYCAISPLSVVWLRSALITKLDGDLVDSMQWRHELGRKGEGGAAAPGLVMAC